MSCTNANESHVPYYTFMMTLETLHFLEIYNDDNCMKFF